MAAHLFGHSSVHSLGQIVASTYPLPTLGQAKEKRQLLPSGGSQPGGERGQHTMDEHSDKAAQRQGWGAEAHLGWKGGKTGELQAGVQLGRSRESNNGKG